jgi:hypothetical protein
VLFRVLRSWDRRLVRAQNVTEETLVQIIESIFSVFRPRKIRLETGFYGVRLGTVRERNTRRGAGSGFIELVQHLQRIEHFSGHPFSLWGRGRFLDPFEQELFPSGRVILISQGVNVDLKLTYLVVKLQ